MQARTQHPAGPARIAAFMLVALAALALVALHLASREDRVAVPAGAHAGQLKLKPCAYATERGDHAADCGTLVVPENRHDERSRLIALPVTRIRARTQHPGAPIFRLEGGPGLTNMTFPAASRFAERRDVVLVGYRGVDGSSVLDCPEVSSAMKRSADFLGTRSFVAHARAFRTCASRLASDGVDLAGYSLVQRADDFEAARRALGYGRIDLLSESAGTRTAMIYAWRYPTRVHRSVMVSANPPGHYLWDARTIDRQIGEYAGLCANDDACRARTGDLAATMKTPIPDHWGPLPIKPGNVRVASFFGLMHVTKHAAPISGPMTLDSWLAAAKGDASGFWFQSLMAQLVLPETQVWGDVAAAGRVDAGEAGRSFTPAANRGTILGNPGTDFLWGGGRLRDAWPAQPDEDRYDHVRASGVPTLLVGGSLDFAAPAENATNELLPHLRNGRQVVLPGFGHTTDFWNAQPAAGSHLVTTFLDSGKVDASRYTVARVDFTPAMTQPAIAKLLLGVMVGLAALALLSLLWLARRVRVRGGVGRKASAVLRTAYPLLLGLGGWFAGLLVVLTLAPTVPLDDALLAVLSIGVPIGLGIYAGWVRRDLAPGARTAGFVAALAGAFAGAWLGFHVVTGFVAVATTIVGAIVGANLVLLVLDSARGDAARVTAPAPSRPVVTSARV